MQALDPRMPWRRFQRAIVMLMAASLAVASLEGCAPGGLAGQPPALALDPSDPCRADREDFAKSKTYFTDQILTGAATGALLGGATAAAVAAFTGGNVAKAALIGGGAGLVVGGATAYAKTMTERSKDQLELANNINADLTKEGDEIDHTGATFAHLRRCRFDQARMIKTQTRTHQLDRKSALEQLAYQQDRFSEEIKLAHDYGLSMVKRSAQFADAAAQIKQDQIDAANRAAAANGASQAANEAALVKMAATKSIPEKRASFDKSVNSAETSSKTAFNLDSNGKFTALPLGATHA